MKADNRYQIRKTKNEDKPKIGVRFRWCPLPLGGYWEFPGGKVESGEQNRKALERELREELGMHVEIQEFLNSYIHHYESFSINLIAFKCKFISATFDLVDHDAFKWVSLTQINNYALAAADIPILNSLISDRKNIH